MTRLTPNARVLVTGGTGFLGAYIVSRLVEKGYRVRGIRRGKPLPSFLPAPIWDKVEWVSGDV
ncbi:MAG TPA: NAD-dependent epimerase/dehydratase family protein, partial [Puia sp.]|nr:NAD-dependent epimerase/dehydratase family protein [Puia sp.]